MKPFLRKTSLGYAQYFFDFTVGYALTCLGNQKIFFLDSILSESLNLWLLDNLFAIVAISFGLGLIVRILENKRNSDLLEKAVYDNVCKDIFQRFIKTAPVEINKIRVSLLKADGEDTEKPKLRVIGRHQVKKPMKKCRINFSVGEGCAGIAYETDSFVYKQIDEYNPNQSDNYYKQSEEVFRLQKKKAEKLNDKACEFLCYPVHFFKEDRSWGVLSLDSEICDTLKNLDHRKIEEALGSFSPLLML